MTTTPLPDLIARLEKIAATAQKCGYGVSRLELADLVRHSQEELSQSITHLERLALLEAAVTDEEIADLVDEIDEIEETGPSRTTVGIKWLKSCGDTIKRLFLQVKAGREALARVTDYLANGGEHFHDPGSECWRCVALTLAFQNPSQQS